LLLQPLGRQGRHVQHGHGTHQCGNPETGERTYEEDSTPEKWANKLGLITSYDLPVQTGAEVEEKHKDTYLRTLFIHGARSVLQHCGNKTDRFSLWAKALEERRGFNKACVAIANKLARVSWVVMAREEEFNPAL